MIYIPIASDIMRNLKMSTDYTYSWRDFIIVKKNIHFSLGTNAKAIVIKRKHMYLL